MRANSYDPKADAAYVYLGETAILESDEVTPGVVLDFDAEGRVVGIEILNASKTLAKGSWRDWPPPVEDVHSHAAE